VPVSKRIRYEVLRRDSYTCRYCGAKAPEAKITVDHVVPVALGGSDDPSNLAAACDPCNGGKTSSSPDAPVVADVSEDALRWSHAMSEAAEQMRADHAARQHTYSQFEEWWGGWNYGFKKLPLPRPDDWRNSIDSFLAAGLPLDVLRWCVDKAGASKVPPESTWRYMCGIAWSKVTELQEAARSLIGAGGEDAQDAGPQTPDQYAEHLLAWLTDAERAKAYENEDAVHGDEPPESEVGRSAGALWFAFRTVHNDRGLLRSSLSRLIRTLPDERGLRAMEQVETILRDRFGDDFDRDTALLNAAYELTEETLEAEASAYFAALPADDREAWVARARTIYGDIDWTVGGDEFYLIEAANLARESAEAKA